MKKVTRLLILTAFVFPIFTVSRAYAGIPGPGQRMISAGERERLGLDPIIEGTQTPAQDPFRLQEPIGNNIIDLDPNRDHLLSRDPFNMRDPFPQSGPPAWESGSNGGGTAPLDGGISLLLAAGIGLGLKKARAKSKANQNANAVEEA
jgi:hypothetical protein